MFNMENWWKSTDPPKDSVYYSLGLELGEGRGWELTSPRGWSDKFG